MQKTTEAYKAWLSQHMPATFKAEVLANELEILAHTLVYNEAFEEYVHLNFGASHSLVVCLDHESADIEILKHYGESRLAIPEYRTWVSDAPLQPYTRNLRIARLNFADMTDKEDLLPMPEGAEKQLYQSAQERDAVQYKFFTVQGKSTLCFAWKNVQRRNFLARLVAMFGRYKLHVTCVRFSYIKPLSTACILMGMLEIESPLVNDAYHMHRVCREFELLKNFRGNDLLEPLVEKAVITGNQANLLRALTSLIGQILVDVDAAMYTEDAIVEAFASQVSLTVDLLAVFEAKFLPKRHDNALHAKLFAELEAKLASVDTGMKKNDDRRRMIFGQALNVIRHMLRTNMYEVNKLGIGFRLNPSYMDNVPGFDRKIKYPELPFSVYYVKGWNYFGFQVRFRDLARGGMRTVVSWGAEHEQYERGNMFTECYNLAYTQQKKNKDIPEGGSKSILFLAANEELTHEMQLAERELRLTGHTEEQIKEALAKFQKDQTTEYMYYNQRCFLNTFMKLFIWDFEKGKLKYGDNTIDYLNLPEYLYLGPDENFHDCMIQWLAKESVRLGYYSGGAFISGKEHAGVSHKEYGVTSWGALQFLNQSLPYMGINGKFTCKITGGPDGDVAGNFMLLLKKYYADRAIVTVITDGSGTCYDPEGLDLAALERMFHKVQMMQDFPMEKLHKGAWVLCMKKTRQPTPLTKECLMYKKTADGKVVEEWISFSQGNKLWATQAHVVQSDVFLPCGGRPRALNMTNIQTFFTDGKPNSILIVEGANLYTTPDAREYLEDRGVLIMRDSSANKCGVVSSSYEILAGLTMTDDQFMEVKKELAENILTRLAHIANDEAKCMIDYHAKNQKKVRMTKISEIVSAQINRYTDDIAAYLKPLNLEAPENKPLLDVFINYIPECIRSRHLAVCLKRVPDMHKKAVISTRIACSLVYGRGLDWQPTVVDVLPLILKTL